MLAKRAEIERKPGAAALEMTASMEAAAAKGDWQRVETLVVKLRAAVMDVPEAERRDTLLAVSRGTDRVEALARSAQGDVTERLSAIRRGRDAARAYGSTTAMPEPDEQRSPGA